MPTQTLDGKRLASFSSSSKVCLLLCREKQDNFLDSQAELPENVSEIQDEVCVCVGGGGVKGQSGSIFQQGGGMGVTFELVCVVLQVMHFHPPV